MAAAANTSRRAADCRTTDVAGILQRITGRRRARSARLAVAILGTRRLVPHLHHHSTPPRPTTHNSPRTPSLALPPGGSGSATDRLSLARSESVSLYTAPIPSPERECVANSIAAQRLLERPLPLHSSFARPRPPPAAARPFDCSLRAALQAQAHRRPSRSLRRLFEDLVFSLPSTNSASPPLLLAIRCVLLLFLLLPSPLRLPTRPVFGCASTSV
ncbi:hypothetical protein P153DRAFT_389209 [Dothidotthia symphoricarpi CBS 119687]|uniref:Uncharacterized protein n=1 Tax=Dothidotthia symphoricarpi CBS 119687 TaxID=1392245 RepID=A0A6A6A1P4_9PLEO|nr:uncharacterized protein P153DRAFT_389209 [Dothidotthia symphoricarpi CBS 119687]KAF2125759.1 hypothetical protein P153DRAFT_389209 [Dothidotthia symphoricarpi CBS 119687]